MSGALQVWSGNVSAGLLARTGASVAGAAHTFAYHTTELAGEAQVSLTMPIRLESWNSQELHPIFQMNLPEGALLDAIKRAVSKITEADSLSILRVTGGNQVGRNRFSLPGDRFPGIQETSESLEELLTYPDTVELFHDLLNRYSLRSGVSGVQPKVLLLAEERGTATVGQFIVKSWGIEFPQLAANEFFCMTAARRAGLPVPEFHLAENGGLFIMKRFDVGDAGNALGFEDMCVLQALGTDRKYQSTYERIARSISDFVSPEWKQHAREQFFATLALSIMVRNGDAHLKNFGVLYEAPGAPVRFAPTYDIVTTTAYLPKDVPALAIAGTKKWWPKKMLQKFALSHLGIAPGKVNEILERVADSVLGTRADLTAYMHDHSEFAEVGSRMLAEWEAATDSLMT
ncbi:type II toxin-antitoxin system HipA family toxin [Geomonas nitrogeniifigens]|uniref:Type II toxin-antitoxin system HipA family toxin n=1 Tax=Geomonas diazotrophica TaxID=2843197 RepID=A0ABX8JJF1_9BACT|nr:type II toxin-antitoxin system HipA family toxin [Geomonas nitrogeniifigens]QWV97291.1 type II toxin-antitoxin system HipA family toxin [Geomonas nitrogeniifigens]